MKRTVLSLVVLAVFGATALADVLKVPSDYPTIKSAVIPAGVGDTVVIQAGVYHEGDLDLENKTDVTVRGVGKVVIDAAGSLRGFWVQAGSGVVLKNLHVRNALWEGVIITNSHQVSVEECEIVDTGKEGILARASSRAIRVAGCTIRRTGANAVHVEAPDSVVSGNKITDLQGVAAVHVDAFNVVVRKNKITDINDDGVRVVVTGGPSRVVVADNTIKRAWYGISVETGVSGVTITDNRIVKPVASGMHIRGATHGVAGNEIVGSSDRGVFLIADDSSLFGNEVVQPAGHGVYVYGDRNTVGGNRVENAGESGFVIGTGADDNFLCDNVAKKSGDYDLLDYAGAAENTLLNNKFKVVSP